MSSWLVTGASSGIGAALARLLASQGHTVGIVARREDRLKEVLDDCGPDARMWVGDLGDLDFARRVALEAWDAFGGLDVLCNNAAIPKRRPVTELSDEEVERVMRINFFSPATMTLALLPRMLERGSGAIVNVASTGGRLGIIHEAAYCASKFALSGWSESMAVDLWDTPIKVRLVQPGPIDTEIWDLPDNEDPIFQGDKVPPSVVAEGIVACLDADGFEHWLPNDMKGIAEFKASNIDVFLEGTASMGRQGGGA